MGNNNLPIGIKINTLLAETDKSQKELAEYLGVVPNIISYYCNGKRIPDIQKLMKIADFFGVSVDYLLGRTNYKGSEDIERDICDYTGLSEEALKTLFSYNMIGFIKIVNYLLEEEHLKFIVDFGMLIHDSRKIFTKKEEPLKEARDGYVMTLDEECDLMRYRLSENFTRLLDEFDVRINAYKKYKKSSHINKEEIDNLRNSNQEYIDYRDEELKEQILFDRFGDFLREQENNSKDTKE